MTWYNLTAEETAEQYHWGTLPQAEKDELKRFLQDLRVELPAALLALGGMDPGPFLGAVIGGSLAQGLASKFSDYDVFLFRAGGASLFTPDNPRIAQNAVGHVVHYRQRFYDLPRRVNLFCGPFGMFYESAAEGSVFGYDLDTDTLYPTLTACRDALL